MSVELHYNLSVKVLETLTDLLDLGTGGVVTHEISGLFGYRDADTTVTVSNVWSDQRTLAAGTDTIDLTSLDRGTDLSAEDFTGLYVKMIVVRAADANTAAIVVTKGGANGYQIWGSASGEVQVGASGVIAMYAGEATGSPPIVAAGAKNITVTSTDLDAIYDILVVAGAVT